MNYSFVIQADSARGQRDHQDGLSSQMDWRPWVWLDEEGLRACKCMLNQCSDYDDA